MNTATKIVLALGIVAIDAVAFVVPVGALLIAYVILFNPPWVRDFLDKLDRKAG